MLVSWLKSGSVKSDRNPLKPFAMGICTRCELAMASDGASDAKTSFSTMPRATATSGPWIQRLALNRLTAGCSQSTSTTSDSSATTSAPGWMNENMWPRAESVFSPPAPANARLPLGSAS